MGMRCWVMLSTLVVAGGCLQPESFKCGDLTCPASKQCVADQRCADPVDIEACNGKLDGELCTVGGGVGRCDLGVCEASGCGNGVMDVGEGCDDGNQVSGDGCRGDCSKLEVCGDTEIDEGEGCDDGNTSPVDGCDNECQPNQWVAVSVIGAAKTGAVEAPETVVAAPGGVLYLAGNYRVQRLDPDGTVTAIAGTGSPGYSGDGGTATGATFARIVGMAVDGLNNLYLADTSNGAVRRVDDRGIITTVAGGGAPCALTDPCGDGGQAAGASVTAIGVAVDGLGNLYIADLQGRIRKVGVDGMISTIAGSGTLCAAETDTCGDGGPATAAQLRAPYALAIDSGGYVYFTDLFDYGTSVTSRIRRISPSGTIVTLATLPTTNLSNGNAIAIAADGALIVADADHHQVQRIADPKVVPAAIVLTTIAGNSSTVGQGGDGGPAASALFRFPGSVSTSADGVYIIDYGNRDVRRIDPTGTISTLTSDLNGYGDGGAAESALLEGPVHVAIGAPGELLISDTMRGRIRRVRVDGTIETVASGVSPVAVARAANGTLYVAEFANGVHRVRSIDTNGVISPFAGVGSFGFSGEGGPPTAAKLRVPTGIAVAPDGSVYIADSGNHCIRRVSSNMINAVAGVCTASGDDGDGVVGGALSAHFNTPSALAFDTAGNLYIADRLNHRVRKLTAAGTVTTVAGNGTMCADPTSACGDGTVGGATAAQLAEPWGVAVDTSGNVFIADSKDLRVRKVNAAGTITTVAGTGETGFTGDAGPATQAKIKLPRSVAVDATGNLFIVGFASSGVPGSRFIRKVDTAGVIRSIAGPLDPPNTGPLGQGRLADPRAIVVTPTFTLFAGGASGTVQTVRQNWLEVAAGRYDPRDDAQNELYRQVPMGNLARYRGGLFGEVDGVAYDATAKALYLTEATANSLHVINTVDPAVRETWTIAPLANTAGIAGHADGSLATARFRHPEGLYLDQAAHALYVADTGNHVIRKLDLSTLQVSTVAGVPERRGFSGDTGAPTLALMYQPRALTRCPNGDLFIADTGNHRVRRIANGTITTVLGVGVAASAGDGSPASGFPVDSPLGLACDERGNLFVSSRTTVRMLVANENGIVDGQGDVQTIYGREPRTTFPSSATRCLSGIAVVDPVRVQVADSCAGLLVELQLQP